MNNSKIFRGFVTSMFLQKVFRHEISRSSFLEVFCEKAVLRNFAKFTGKHLCQSLFFNKVAGGAWCFPKNFAKFLSTPFLTEHLWWLFLWIRRIVEQRLNRDKTKILCLLIWYRHNYKWWPNKWLCFKRWWITKNK